MKRRFLASLIYIFAVIQLVFGYELSILHSNDIHGRLMPIDYNSKVDIGGWARRAGTIKDIKSKVKNTLILDAGDVAQGTVYYQLFDGMPEMNFLQICGYDAMTVGNHELDKGVENFENLTKLSKTPILAANLTFKNNFYLNGKIKSHILKTYDGFKVGVIGMTTPYLKKMSASSEYIELSDYYKTLKFLVNYLRDDVDLLVLLSHSGYKKDIATAKKIDGIDVIVGGHSHTFTKKPYVVNKSGRKTLIVQSGEFGLNLGRLDLQFERSGIQRYDFYLMPLDKNAQVDKKILKDVEKLDKDVATLRATKIGKTKIDIDARKDSLRTQNTNAGVLVCSAMKKLVPEADAVIVNSGSIRLHDIIHKGSITTMDIMEMLPFPSKMVISELQGKDIRSILETSVSELPYENRSFLQTLGLSYTLNLSAQPQLMTHNLSDIKVKGVRVGNIMINNKVLDDEQYYKILTSDFLQSGGDAYFQFRNARTVRNTNYPIVKAVIDYIKAKKRIKPQVRDEIIVKE